ncbi:MAG: hypothetical protein EOL88_13580 [Bacteroidia bacterium]|nr:hypothetical protein [Bacteroidia bacterium]
MNRLKRIMYKSLEMKLSPREKQRLDRAMEKSPQLRRELFLAKEIRSAVQQPKNSFSPWFEAKVINKINNLGNPERVGLSPLLQTYRTATLIGLVAIAAVVVVALVLNGSLTLEATTGLETINAENLTAFLAFEY